MDPGVSREALRAAYHRKLLATHPDKASPEKAEDVSITQIKQAYETLSDAEKCKQYDAELTEMFKKEGFSITGAGLDLYTLASFEVLEDADPVWSRDCPRCSAQNSIELRETDLEIGTPDGLGGYQIMAPCQSCSLWITVLYEEE